MQDRIACDVLAGFATQQNANRGIVALFAFEFIVHPNIHINLADILMGDRAHFQINQNIAFQFDVIEHKVDVEVIQLSANMLLAGYDDQKISEQLTPPLTSIQLPYSELGRLAVEYLCNQEDAATHVTLAGRLKVRASSLV